MVPGPRLPHLAHARPMHPPWLWMRCEQVEETENLIRDVKRAREVGREEREAFLRRKAAQSAIEVS